MGGKTFAGPGVGFGAGVGCGFGIGYGFGGGPIGFAGMGAGGGCGVGIGLGWGQGAAWGAKYIVIEPEFIQNRERRPKWVVDLVNHVQALSGNKGRQDTKAGAKHSSTF